VNVLLLQPPQIQGSPQGVSSFSLGLAYIAATLREEGAQVSLLDCYSEKTKQSVALGEGLYRIGLSDEEITEKVKEIKPDIVGISLGFSKQFHAAVGLASLVRSVDKSVPVVAGGAHVSAAPESLNDSDFDYLVSGEGERAFSKLVRAISSGLTGDPKVAGIFYRDQQSVFSLSACQEVITDLDSLPLPAYDLLPLQKAWSGRVPYANIIATRGCPYSCNFCSIHSVMSRRLRRRSIASVISEIELLVQTYGVKEIFFEDDNVTAKIDWAKELFMKIADKKMDIEIGVRNGIRADRVDKELLELMRRAGCTRVCFAPESGSQDTLDNIVNKCMDLENVKSAVMLAKSAGLNVTCFFVIGFPGETKADIQKTIDFAKLLRKIGCDSVDINCATPYPGTALYAQCIQEGYIDNNVDYARFHTHESIISTKEFTSEEVMQLRKEAMESLVEGNSEKVLRVAGNLVRQPALMAKRKVRGFYYSHIRHSA